MKKYLVIFLLLITAVMLLANNPIHITITGQLTFNNFPVSSIDPMNPDEQPIIFTVNIANQEPEMISQDEFVGTFIVAWNEDELVNITDLEPKFDMQANEVKIFQSRDFIVSPDATGYEAYFGSDIDMDDILNQNPDLEDIVMSTGKFPDGTYSFSLSFRDADSGELISNVVTHTITVTSPSATTLIYPGALLGTRVGSVMSETPSFTWSSNQPSFNFMLFELNDESTDASAIDVIEPIWVAEGINSPYQYPASAPSLTAGNVYAWKVETNISAPGRNSVIESDYFVFEIGSDSDINDMEDQMLETGLSMLNISGNTAIADLLSQGYSPVGPIIFNGEEKSIEEILSLIVQLQNEGKTVNSVSVE